MPVQQTETVKIIDVIDGLKHFIRHMLKQWLIIFVTVLATVLIAFSYYFFQKPAYEGSVTFILEEKSSMGGGLSNIASQFGFDIGSITGGSSGMFSGDNILDILKSRVIMEKVLLSKVDSTKGANSPTLADLFINVGGFAKKWQGKPQLANISFAGIVPGKPNTILQDSVLNIIYKRLYNKHITVERLNKKGSIIKINTTSTNQEFSKLFTERLLDETRSMYVQIKTGFANANVARLERKADSLMRIINNKAYEAASLQVLDANTAFKSSAVPVESSQRDKTVAYAVYTEVVKNLEATRMAVASQTPVIQLLDTPKYPLEDNKKDVPFLLVFGIIAGLLFSFAYCLLTYSADRSKR
ncbi:MAG: Wzz/FepE/Etk N-terminal domain-containing protein [Bacteroidota bacterium]